ncbi:Cryptochrome-1 [Dionaea muscipula]
MWQDEAAARAINDNGREGLGNSSESTQIAFPQELQMDVNDEPTTRDNETTMNRGYEDQMVPSITSSFIRYEDEETSDVRNSTAGGRAVVPRNVNMNQETESFYQGVQANATRSHNVQRQWNFSIGLRDVEESTADSSSCRLVFYQGFKLILTNINESDFKGCLVIIELPDNVGCSELEICPMVGGDRGLDFPDVAGAVLPDAGDEPDEDDLPNGGGLPDAVVCSTEVVCSTSWSSRRR